MKNAFDYDGKFSKRYYSSASERNVNIYKREFFKKAKDFLNKNSIICDFGCGDASGLMHLGNVKAIYGFDLSREAIKKAKIHVPKGKFYVGNNGERFKENFFDATLSFYVLEHVKDPKEFIDVMIKKTKKGGYIICYCPNYGSPLFPSPPEMRGLGFLRRILLVLKRIREISIKNMIYRNVNPILDLEWKSDYDTISEVSLEKITKVYRDKLVYFNSYWSFKPALYIPFALLGFLGIKPFIYWGFNCFFVLKK